MPSPAPAPPRSAACRAGRHDAIAATRDASGTEHARCRRCGCELARLPVLRRWYRTGLMG